MKDVLRRKWHALLQTWDVAATLADQTLEDIREHYTGPGRFYHTLVHIENVLETMESLDAYAQNPPAVQLAAWLHDVIYDSRAADNEDRSAEYAERLCKTLAIPVGRRVASLILRTKTHDAAGDDDAQVLLDADLAILGASHSDYRAYREMIRQEYAWVPELDYRQGRSRVLQSFLNRPRIFHILCHLEDPARRNIVAEIAQLASD